MFRGKTVSPGDGELHKCCGLLILVTGDIEILLML